MDTSLLKTFGLAVITVVITVFVMQASGSALNQASGTLVVDTTYHDSTVHPRWVNDGNLLAMIGTMNAKQLTAADLLLSAWHSDTVRDLAIAMTKQHTAMQRETDSLAARLDLAPVPSALGATVSAAFQRQTDSLITGRSGMKLDRGYVNQAVAGHTLMGSYLGEMSKVVDRPELKEWIDTLGTRVAAQLAYAKSVQAKMVVADSLVADSLAKRAARRARRDSLANRVSVPPQ